MDMPLITNVFRSIHLYFYTIFSLLSCEHHTGFFLTLILYIYTYVGQVLCIFNDFIIIISPLLDIVTQHTV